VLPLVGKSLDNEFYFDVMAMELPRDAILLRIFIGEKDVYEGEPLFRAIVLKARQNQLAGATVFRGPLGFGKSSHLHTNDILRLSFDLPVVIEIVDTEEKIQSFLPSIEKIIGPGLVTIEPVQAIFYKGLTDQP
jgi:PII-like signaling protein